MACTGCNKLDTFDWLKDVPMNFLESDLVEVRFKNTRKEFYRNTQGIPLVYGEMITVEANNGHDVGTVSLVGRLAEKQFVKKTGKPLNEPLKSIYRKANINDLQLYQLAKDNEAAILYQARQIADNLKLNMKISDIEYQGDNKRATFFYIAEDRVDFRELIKIYADTFRVKIEMRQIGSRQEAGRVGGIGSCGRELCCSTWRTHLPTVPQSTVSQQNLNSANEKYLGQCGKLKCCLTYELETYIEARADFPKEILELETKQGIAYPFKIDILAKEVWYQYQTKLPSEIHKVSIEKVKEYIQLNKRGVKVEI